MRAILRLCSVYAHLIRFPPASRLQIGARWSYNRSMDSGKTKRADPAIQIPKKTLKYSSVAISGRPGAGRSTLLSNLRSRLEPLKWEVFSGGDWSRQFAIKEGRHEAGDAKHHLA